MLENLHVKNLALIDEQEITFTRGLNILTGETGAGKSIVLGSIHLALGAKADKDSIRSGADYALIELVFSLNDIQKKQMGDSFRGGWDAAFTTEDYAGQEYLPDQWRNGECQSVKGAFRVPHGHVWSA